MTSHTVSFAQYENSLYSFFAVTLAPDFRKICVHFCKLEQTAQQSFKSTRNSATVGRVSLIYVIVTYIYQLFIFSQ